MSGDLKETRITINYRITPDLNMSVEVVRIGNDDPYEAGREDGAAVTRYLAGYGAGAAEENEDP